MRLLLVTPWLTPLGGGLERYATSLSEIFAATGHDVTLLAHAHEDVTDTATGVTRIGVRPAARLSNTPIGTALYRKARALLRAGRFEVVNVHTPVPGTAELAFLAARQECVPVVVTYHAGTLASGSPFLAPLAALHRATFERRMLSKADARIAVSSFVAKNVYRERPSNVIMPGVDAERFSPGGSPVKGRVLFVAPPDKAYAWKGLATLADAVALVPDATLRIVGDGDLADHYRDRGATVTGRLSDERLVEEYRSASVVALPSITDAESFGMVLAEANACGRPIVGTRAGGIPCFLHDGENGLLAKPRDAPSLAQALRSILEDESLARRLGEAGRARVLADHRWSDVAARTLLVLQRAVQGRTPTRVS